VGAYAHVVIGVALLSTADDDRAEVGGGRNRHVAAILTWLDLGLATHENQWNRPGT